MHSLLFWFKANRYLWCLGTTSPLLFRMDLKGWQGIILANCWVRYMPQSRHRCKVAAVWKISRSGCGVGSHKEQINFVYKRLCIRSRLSINSSTSVGLYKWDSLKKCLESWFCHISIYFDIFWHNVTYFDIFLTYFDIF